jgi:diaminopimelate epimerase
MTKTSGLSVSRMSGAQNTFLIANIFDPIWSQKYSSMTKSEKAQLAKRLCEGFFGFHTDGLLFLHPEKEFDFAWDFYNSDGSFAEMCGNAARCATLFFNLKVKPQKKVHFLTGAGEITGEVLDSNQVRVEMTKVSDLKTMQALGQSGLYVNTGVPHFVLNQAADAQLAKKLRQVQDFGPAGANITFVENIKEQSMDAVTFERGVEDFTQACGTGAVAAAMYLQEQKGSKATIEVQMPGGLLKIENAKSGERPLLTGPAQFEFDIEHWEHL